jgi:hypothetical protein
MRAVVGRSGALIHIFNAKQSTCAWHKTFLALTRVAAFRVDADLLTAMGASGTLVYVFTCVAVLAQSKPRPASTLVAAKGVCTVVTAASSFLPAFIDVFAGPSVYSEMVANITAALESTQSVGALSFTTVCVLATFVNVCTGNIVG